MAELRIVAAPHAWNRRHQRAMTDRLEAMHSASAHSPDAVVRQELATAHRELRAFLRRRLGDAGEADEVLQTFAVKALSSSWSLRDVASVRAWLGRILATTLVDHYRRRAAVRRVQAPEDAADLDRLAASGNELDGAICECLHALLPTLRPAYAEAIRRLDILGEPRDGVATELGVSVNSLTVRLHRARKATRDGLEAMCLTCPEHGYFNCRCEQERRRAEVRVRARAEFT